MDSPQGLIDQHNPYANTVATVSNTVMINVSMMALPVHPGTHVDTLSPASTQMGNQKDRLRPR